MPFPVQDLTSRGGRCYAHLFENRATRLPRDLFWSFTIDFEPIDLSDSEFSPSATVEWVVLGVRDWRELVGVSLSGSYGDGGIESSFYVFEHHYAPRFALQVSGRRERETGRRDPRQLGELELSLQLLVDYPGYDGDPEPELEIGGSAWVEFEGIIVSPDGLFPKPTTLEETRNALRPYIDTDLLAEPKPGRHTWRSHTPG